MATQGLVIRAGIYREHLLQHVSGRPIRHQGRELDPQPVQLRGRAGVRRPVHTGLGHAAVGTAEAGKPDRDLAEQRRNPMLAIVLHLAGFATAAALRTTHGMDPGLRGDDLLLEASQEFLALGQGQTQAAQIGEVLGPGEPQDVGAVFFPVSSSADQSHDPGHVVSTSTGKQTGKYPLWSRTPKFAPVPEHIRTITAYLVFPDWTALMQTLIDSKPPPHVEAQL